MRTVDKYAGLALIQTLPYFIKGIRSIIRTYISKSGFICDKKLRDYYHLDIKRAFMQLHWNNVETMLISFFMAESLMPALKTLLKKAEITTILQLF